VSRLTPPVSEADRRSGPDDAPVTLVEYGDFECPSCGAAYPNVEDVRKKMGARLRFVFRHFPLTQMHPHAMHAAEAAEAAGAQGKFWQMHGMLFEHQDALEDEDLVRYAKSLHLDDKRFASELASDAYVKGIRQGIGSGIRSGVNGTPTFFINGVRYDGSWDASDLLAALEAAAA
jgi:protein-disulfide isomerase